MSSTFNYKVTILLHIAPVPGCFYLKTVSYLGFIGIVISMATMEQSFSVSKHNVNVLKY